MIIRIHDAHLRQIIFVGIRSIHGHADQPSGILRHKIHIFSSGKFCGTDHVALILPILIVHDDHVMPGPKLLQNFLDRIQLHVKLFLR